MSTHGTDSERSQITQHWNTVTQVCKSRWWNWPRVIAHQNEIICGKRLYGWGKGLQCKIQEMFPHKVFKKGISIACGTAAKERLLIKAGIVESFDLFELSDTRVALGKEQYASEQLSDRVTWHIYDGLVHLKETPPASYDFIYWDSALHHMFDVEFAIQASWNALCTGGCFAMLDFVGPSRFQWSDCIIKYGTLLRSMLPKEYLHWPNGTQTMIAKQLRRPNPQTLQQSDPSEAVDSGRIIPAIQKIIPNASIWMLGGAVYHAMLNDVFSNFCEEHDGALLEALLVLDTVLLHECNESLFAAVLGRKDD